MEPKARKKPGPPPSAPCGTRSAYQRHLRWGEKPCDACAAVHRDHVRVAVAAHRARKKAARNPNQ